MAHLCKAGEVQIKRRYLEVKMGAFANIGSDIEELGFGVD